MKNSIKVERAIKNITQAQLAELVNVHRQTINQIELGRYNLSTILALKIANVFEKNVNDIFQLEESDWER
jgi:putative transcriptional regulator